MSPQQVLEQLQSTLASHQKGDLDTAAAGYQRVLAVQPNNADSLHLLGVLEGQRGRPEVGLPLIQRATQLLPNVADFHRHLGEILALLRRHNEAIAAFAQAIRLNPRDAAAHSDAASSLFALNRIPEAVERFRIAWELSPNSGLMAGNYGYGLMKLGQFDQAVRVLRRAVELTPNDASPWLQLGEALWRMGRYDDALGPARRGVELAPNDVRALLVLGNTLQTLGQFPQTVEAYARVLAIDPSNFDAVSNTALTLLKMGEAQRSLEMYEKICARWPNNADALANRSLALLTLGDFERGFAEYETRWNSAAFQKHQFRQPRWDGSDPSGKTILLINEQGLGDTIQFVRYAPLLAERAARVLVVCQPELSGLIASVKGISAQFTPDSPVPAFDVYAPMASLPAMFKTTLDTIPADVPYVRAAAAQVETWRRRLASSPGLKVGIAWAGSPMHQNDRARSCRLADFAPLAGIEGVSFFSLQKGPSAAQLASPPVGMRITSLGEELTDFTHTASLIDALDMLISVDTSIVHVAGALARPVWTLLAKGPDWRWMLNRPDTPWYPTMRLFRQRALADWSTVFEQVTAELRTLPSA